MRLALALKKFPHEIDEMPMSDFLEFMLYEQLEPFDDARGDLHAAIIASTLVNLKLKPGSFVSPDKFIPKFWEDSTEPVEPMSAEQQLAAILLLQAAQNKIPS